MRNSLGFNLVIRINATFYKLDTAPDFIGKTFLMKLNKYHAHKAKLTGNENLNQSLKGKLHILLPYLPFYFK